LPEVHGQVGLWKQERWPGRSNVATLAEAMVAHGPFAETAPEMQAIIDDGGTRLD
jgi:hypothetical protein